LAAGVPDAPRGYDPLFLTVPLPLPSPPATAAVQTLPFTHFTVVLQPARRLAAVTGVNVDGSQLLDLDRGDDWHLDPRVPADMQCGPEIYADNDLDRGHLTRRRDPVWGGATTAAQANLDSFTYVNAAPQAALFNQGELLWAGLENYILDHARTYHQRLSVFTAPVLADDDPPYRGIKIPRRFWKIAVWATTPVTSDQPTPSLAATGYLLDQTPQLSLIDLTDRERLTPSSPPPLGAYLTYQVPISDIAAMTGLDLGPLPAADRLPIPQQALTSEDRWRLLQQLDDMAL
jgi:endonuclease G